MKDIREIIKSRRSCRAFSAQPLSRAEIEAMIAEAVWVPSGSNRQPWRFAVIEGNDQLRKYSNLSKKLWLDNLDQTPQMKQYESSLRDEKYNIFYNAATLIAIYGSTESPWYLYDCTMVAYNLMLLAECDGLGSCWIGYAHNIFELEEVKRELDIPAKYRLVAPIIIGHPQHSHPATGVPRQGYVTTFKGQES